MSKIPKHLEKAIIEMPQTEKDKLLLRLVVKEPLLLEKLEHQLLGDANDTIDRRNEILEVIKEMAKYAYYETPGWLMMGMRDQSGNISRHIKITKDKLGEPILLLALINEVFRNQKILLEKHTKRADKFSEYVVNKGRTTLDKLKKVPADYHIEFESEVNEMLDYIHNYPPCQYFLKAIPLPKKWNP